MGDIGDAFREIKEERGERKRKRKLSNTEIVMGLQGDINYDFEVDTIAPYQLRIISGIDGKKLDFFPTSNKGSWVGSNKFFIIPDIEKFIMDNYKSKK